MHLASSTGLGIALLRLFSGPSGRNVSKGLVSIVQMPNPDGYRDGGTNWRRWRPGRIAWRSAASFRASPTANSAGTEKEGHDVIEEVVNSMRERNSVRVGNVLKGSGCEEGVGSIRWRSGGSFGSGGRMGSRRVR